MGEDNGTVINDYCFPDYPISPGRVGYSNRPPSIATTDNKGVNTGLFGWCYAMHSFLSFYSPAFLCRRGAIRWKYYTQSSTLYAADGNTETGYRTMREFRTNLPDGIGGQCVTSTENQPVLEVELPFYNYHRFAPT